jgi:signal transduction histidine kinase
MRLRNQLLVILAATTGAVVIPVAALLVLSRGVTGVHAASEEAQSELAAKLERVSLTEEYMRGEMDRIETAHSPVPEAHARDKVLASYERVEQLIVSSHDDAATRAETADEAALRAKFIEIADGLSRLPGDAGEHVDDLDRRFDTELLPALFQSAGHESALLAGSVVELEQRATQAGVEAILSLLIGLTVLIVLVQRITQRTRRALEELLTATRALASGHLGTRTPSLQIAEFDEIGRALNRMATDLGEAADARLRVEKLAAVGQLAASVGHEIRNPLAAARNALSYLRRKLGKTAAAAKGDRTIEFIEIADRELAACNRIVQDLLDFARERPLNVTSTSLRAVVEEVLEVVRSRPGVTLANEVPEDLPTLDADRDQLRQVLLNLVQNGIEAIPPERPGRVRVRASVEADGLRISVSDDGGGIPEADRKRIFEPLVTTKAKGTGLGLPITAAIVKRHGGTLELQSAVNEGTSFHINLPLPRERAAE